jgi:dienelactone hydrolase
MRNFISESVTVQNMNVESLNLDTSRGATTAYVARPQTEVDAAVVLIQEWWGINDHIRDLAGRYAKEGYLCVAPDLYRGKVAKDAEESAALMTASRPFAKRSTRLAKLTKSSA